MNERPSREGQEDNHRNWEGEEQPFGEEEHQDGSECNITSEDLDQIAVAKL